VVAAFREAGAVVVAPGRKELDLTDEGAVARFYEGLPSLWASVHVAGGFAMKAVEDTSLEEFLGQWRINAVTAFLACREAVRKMKSWRAGLDGLRGPGGIEGGRIVNVGARAGMEHPGGKMSYVAAKSALHGMTRSLAEEVRPSGILVNAVMPGTIDTPANREAMPGADTTGWSKPEAIAEAILWLASPGNRTVTGALIPV
jgi:NAD(P)-dependent dehydrogenase (short-subunit alcohol dehydrogenase family)